MGRTARAARASVWCGSYCITQGGDFPLCEAFRSWSKSGSGFVSTPRTRSSMLVEDRLVEDRHVEDRHVEDPALSPSTQAVATQASKGPASKGLVQVPVAPVRGRSTPGPREPRDLSRPRSRAPECDRRDNPPLSPTPANPLAASGPRRATRWARHERPPLLPPTRATHATAARYPRAALRPAFERRSGRLPSVPALGSPLLHTSVDHFEHRGGPQRLGRPRFGRGHDGLVQPPHGFPQPPPSQGI